MSIYLSPGIYVKETNFSHYVKQISTSSCAMVGIAERGPINEAQLVTSWEQFVNTYGSFIQTGYLAYAARSFFDNGGNVLYVNRVVHLSDPLNRASITAVKASTHLGYQLKPARLETGTTGTDHILWQAQTPGTNSNQITITLAADAPSQPLSLAVSGQNLTVNLATDASGTPTSTTQEVVTAVKADGAASALVIPNSNETGIVQAHPTSSLSGGQDTADLMRVEAVNGGSWGDTLKIEITHHETDLFHLAVLYKGRQVEIYRNLSLNETSPNHPEQLINGRSTFITVEALTNDPTDRPDPMQSALANGDDGLDGMLDTDFVGDASQRTGIYAFDGIDAVNILAVPGIPSATVIQAGLAYAELRKDLMFLADPPAFLDPLEVLDFRKGQGMYTHAAFDSSYGALYYPWQRITDPLTGREMTIPPSGIVAGIYARTDQKAHVWSAPAGIDRGRVFNVLGPAYKTSKGEMDVLYPEGINCITAFADGGTTVWGQKTLTYEVSAVDRVNVRRLMMYIEEAIGESSRFVVFQPNLPQTWRALIRLINPFLKDIQDNGGLYPHDGQNGFRVQCDEETNTPAVIDRNEMITRIFVKPTKTAEFVELNFVMAGTNTNFDEIFKS